jgi:hypothetical protein
LVYSTIATDGDEAETTTSVLDNEVTHEIGTATGDDHVDGTVTDDGTKINELVGTVTRAVLGTETITDVGTDSGIFVYETITADVDDAIVITSVDGKDETHEYGTTNTDDSAHVDGMVIEFGTYTNDDVGTVTMFDEGTDQIRVVGKLSGTLVYEIITTDGDEADTTTSVLGKDVTHEIGTTTGDDHVDGTATVHDSDGVNV